MVFRVEQNIELFGKELEKVPFQIPFGMIDAADIGVGVEKTKMIREKATIEMETSGYVCRSVAMRGVSMMASPYRSLARMTMLLGWP